VIHHLMLPRSDLEKSWHNCHESEICSMKLKKAATQELCNVAKILRARYSLKKRKNLLWISPISFSHEKRKFQRNTKEKKERFWH
jgi:hypothetical protein